MKSLTKFYELPIFLFLIAFLLILLIYGSFGSAVTDGISLWFFCVVPALFPYLFITAIMSSLSITEKIFSFVSPLTTKTFNVGGRVGYAFIISLISGYPMGAKTVSDLKLSNAITDAESQRGAALCSTSSPVFLISTVGGIMFNDKTFGLSLYLIHILSAIITGFIFSFYKRAEKPSRNHSQLSNKKTANILYDTAYYSVISILIVGALITIFYLLTEVLSACGVLTPVMNLLTRITGDENLAKGITFGLFECTKGLKVMAKVGKSALPFASFVCSFGGLSVIMQSVSFLKKAKIKTAPFIFSKIISAVISLVLSFIFVSLI